MNTSAGLNPFLFSIAEAYVRNESDSLLDYCFVFPNKRSATFFIDYIEQVAREESRDSQFIPPATTTVSYTHLTLPTIA